MIEAELSEIVESAEVTQLPIYMLWVLVRICESSCGRRGKLRAPLDPVTYDRAQAAVQLQSRVVIHLMIIYPTA